MKRLVLTVFAVLGSAGMAAAQSGSFYTNTLSGDRAPKFTAAGEGTNLLSTTGGDAATHAWTSAEPSALPAAPEPAPTPKFYYGSSDDYRWQLGVGFEYVRFRSTAFNANLSGLHTSLTYYVNDWFGLEGNVVAAFGTAPFVIDRSKYLLYTGGARIAWRQRKWEPWVHGLVGGLHMLPQTALGGKNGLAVQAGGGVDLRFNARLSFRMEGDYVRSRLYSQSQNNIQLGGGLVIHF